MRSALPLALQPRVGWLNLTLSRLTFASGVLMVFLVPWERLVTFSGLGTISRLAGLLCACIWLLAVLTRGLRLPSLFHVLFAIFILWNIFSLFWSIAPERTLERVLVYARMFWLSIFIWDVFRSISSTDAVYQAYILGAWFPAMSTIKNFRAGVESEFGRFSSAGDNMNTTAIVLALALPMAIKLSFASKAFHGRLAWPLRYFNLAFVLVGLFAISLTGTRFALLMSLPTLAYAVLLLNSELRGVKKVVVGLLAGSAMILAVQMVPEQLLQRLSSVGSELASGDLTGRLTYWKLGLELWSETPWIGVGSSNFHLALTTHLGRPRSAHNSFIAILVELGLVGLVLAVAIVIFVGVQVFLRARAHDWFPLTLFAVWLLGNLPLTFFHSKSSWLILTSLVTYAATVRRVKDGLGDK